ncbi:MAG TPA: HAMP domain-containing sensor histidine kinase [Candidatus Saccharimonadia bacterium]|nr:HAMP domain-containing sensor histidine kinase [Candidatus Saccharimonadia bacterium]
MAVAVDVARGRPRGSGLRGKLWIAFVLQLAAISAATALSVFGAWIVLREVLIQRALADETGHYWQRLERDPAAPLPDTYNMKSYFAPAGELRSVPPALQPLPPGYHSADLRGKDDLVYVSDGPGGRLYLVFDQEQVDRLAFWFGFVPLSVVLLVIYSTTWFTYRVSRRAISPVIWLANQVREWDPKQPDFRALAPGNLPREADTDMRVLAESLHGFGLQIEDFVERERNFTRDASHELRTPLTLVKVAADVLLSDGELTPYAERSVWRIKRATRDMEALIESFLILARAGDVGLPDDDFVVNAVAAEEIDRARALLDGKPVAVELVEHASFALHAPARVFSVMLANLLRNACSYTERGHITVTIGPDSVEVSDTGSGMTPEQLARVFELYDRAGRTGGRGYGIGLTIVKRLSERFGWPIELASEPGVGTTATLRFPNPQPL